MIALVLVLVLDPRRAMYGYTSSERCLPQFAESPCGSTSRVRAVRRRADRVTTMPPGSSSSETGSRDDAPLGKAIEHEHEYEHEYDGLSAA